MFGVRYPIIPRLFALMFQYPISSPHRTRMFGRGPCLVAMVCLSRGSDPCKQCARERVRVERQLTGSSREIATSVRRRFGCVCERVRDERAGLALRTTATPTSTSALPTLASGSVALDDCRGRRASLGEEVAF